MITKELFAKVEALPLCIIEQFEVIGNSIEYWDTEDERKYFTSINDFAFSCKSKFLSLGYILDSGQTPTCGRCSVDSKTSSKVEYFKSKTEQEAIFKACEYILRESSNKDNK